MSSIQMLQQSLGSNLQPAQPTFTQNTNYSYQPVQSTALQVQSNSYESEMVEEYKPEPLKTTKFQSKSTTVTRLDSLKTKRSSHDEGKIVHLKYSTT
jgi:hypothetical protein